MREVLPVVLLVAFGVILLLLGVLVIASHLRRLRTVRTRLRTDWAAGTASLRTLVNARGRRRDEQETVEWTGASQRNGRAGAA